MEAILGTEYFISKFMGIPVELWNPPIEGGLADMVKEDGTKCALGHCGVKSEYGQYIPTEEALALIKLFGGETGKIDYAAVYRVNDNHRLEGGSPRGRMLRKLFELSVPLHKHDCNKCTYLGRFKDCDLYYCVQIEKIPTLIARYGTGGNYSSGFQFGEAMKDDMECEMGEAWRRAAAIGLIK